MEVADETGEGGKHLSHTARSFSPRDWLIRSVCFHLPWRGARNVSRVNEGQIFHFPVRPSIWRPLCKCKLKTGDHESVHIHIFTVYGRLESLSVSAPRALWSRSFHHVYSVPCVEPTIHSKSHLFLSTCVICFYLPGQEIKEGGRLWLWSQCHCRLYPHQLLLTGSLYLFFKWSVQRLHL